MTSDARPGVSARAFRVGVAVSLLAGALGAQLAAEAGRPTRRASGAATRSSMTPLYVAACIYGQSNAGTSNGGDLPVSTTNGAPSAAPYNNVEYRTSAFFPAYSNTGSANTEELCFGALNQLASRYYAAGASALRGACQEGAVGSRSYAQLADGTANWTAQWAECAAMRTAYTTAFPGALAPTPLVVWMQGETDQVLGTSRATYVANLNTLWTDVCAEFNGAPWSLGAACPQIYMIPYGGVTRLGRPGTATFAAESEIVLAHYEACRDNPERFVCAHAGYASTMVTANEHYDAEGCRTNGAQIARVFEQRAIRGVDWRMFRPNPATMSCTGNVVTVPLIGGTGSSVVVDTTAVARKPHLGFEYSDNGADPASIRSVAVVGESVQLTLSRGCTTGARVRYAAIGEPTCNSGSGGTCGTGGNIRRGDCVASYWGAETLCDWLMPFDEGVATVSSTPDLGRPFVDTGIVARAPTSVSWWTARSSAVTDSVANMTAGAWILTPASTSANQVIMERWGAAGARNWSLRTETTQRLSIFLSADGTAISQVCNTPNSVMTANTWTHVAFTKSGTTLTPYINGTATNCSGTGSTGTTPASLGPGYSSPITFGGSVPGTNNYSTPIAHAVAWDRALSGAEVAQLYTTTPYPRPLDPRPLAPEHYWPMNGRFDDLGTAAARPLAHYGTAGFVETASLWGASDSGHAFGATGAGVLDGATAAWLRADVTMPAGALPQEGTIGERDDASSANRQIAISINTNGQVVTRVAAALSGTGQWPADAGRAECVTTETLAASTRYRLMWRYLGAGATNAERLRVWRSTVTTSADADGTSYVVVGTPVELTCTFLGTIPSSLTSPVATGWSIGRRTATLNVTGLRNAQLNGNALAIWSGLVGDPATTPTDLARAANVYDSPAGAPSLVFRARGPGMVETQVLGASTPSGATSLVYVSTGEWIAAPTTRGPYPTAWLATLGAPWSTVLGQESTAPGASSPFSLTPSGSSPFYAESGIDFMNNVEAGCGACTAPTMSSALPEYVEALGTSSVLGTAGLFTMNFGTASPRDLSVAAGFTISTCTSYRTNVFGDRGALLMVATNYDTLAFQPRQAENVIGYAHDSGDALVDGWYFCTDTNTCTALGTAAPRDDRDYCATIVVEDGATTFSATLIDMSVPSAPRVAHAVTGAALPSTGTYGVEINCSPGPDAPGSQIAHTCRWYYVRGARAYAP